MGKYSVGVMTPINRKCELLAREDPNTASLPIVGRTYLAFGVADRNPPLVLPFTELSPAGGVYPPYP